MIRDDGEPPAPFFLKTDAVNDFEDTSKVAFSTNVDTWANTQSFINHGLNRDAPLSGDSDARVDVEFRDERDTPWGQWAVMEMFFDGVQDFSALKAVRITLKADEERTAGIVLSSPLYTTSDAGGQWGWSVNATAEPETLPSTTSTILCGGTPTRIRLKRC